MTSKSAEANNENVTNVTISLEVASRGRIVSAKIFDFFISLIFTLILLIGTLRIAPCLPSYISAVNQRNELLVESSLYIKKSDGSLITLVSSLESDYSLTKNEKSQKLDETMTTFFSVYINEELQNKGAETYLKYKTDATYENQKMFDEKGNRLLVSADYDGAYYDFYIDTYNYGAIPSLAYKASYASTRREIIWTNFIIILLTMIFSLLLFYMIVPFIFKRGKRTFGMLLMKIAYIDKNGFSCGNIRFLFHSFFEIVFIILSSVPCFLIPLAISLTMLIMRKDDHQTLTDYVIGTYEVSLFNQAKIYNSAYEFLESERKLNNSHMIEDTNIRLK